MPASPARVAAPLPRRGGVGLKADHVDAILAERRDVGFFEIHAENYMGDGGPAHRRLEAIRALYPLSLHGVGLSIGSPRPLDREHLKRLAALVRRYEPGCSPSIWPGRATTEGFLNDLLPLPYTEETLATVCDHIDQTQEALGRAHAARKPLDLRSVRAKHDLRDRFPRRDRAPHRLRAAARRQQRLRLRDQSRLRPDRLSRRLSAWPCRRNPPRRLCRRARRRRPPAADRRPRFAGARSTSSRSTRRRSGASARRRP